MSAEPGSERDMLERNWALNVVILNTRDLNVACESVHRLNQHFYTDIVTGARLNPHPSEKIALMHSELSEMLEGVRKDTFDDHIPSRKTEEVEAADLFIRLMDYVGWRGLDLAGALKAKMKYNTTRADHTAEARRATNGKKF